MGWVQDGASGSVRRRVCFIFLLGLGFEKETEGLVVGMARREKYGGGEERICGDGEKRVAKLIVF